MNTLDNYSDFLLYLNNASPKLTCTGQCVFAAKHPRETVVETVALEQIIAFAKEHPCFVNAPVKEKLQALSNVKKETLLQKKEHCFLVRLWYLLCALGAFLWSQVTTGFGCEVSDERAIEMLDGMDHQQLQSKISEGSCSWGEYRLLLTMKQDLVCSSSNGVNDIIKWHKKMQTEFRDFGYDTPPKLQCSCEATPHVNLSDLLNTFTYDEKQLQALFIRTFTEYTRLYVAISLSTGKHIVVNTYSQFINHLEEQVAALFAPRGALAFMNPLVARLDMHAVARMVANQLSPGLLPIMAILHTNAKEGRARAIAKVITELSTYTELIKCLFYFSRPEDCEVLIRAFACCTMRENYAHCMTLEFLRLLLTSQELQVKKIHYTFKSIWIWEAYFRSPRMHRRNQLTILSNYIKNRQVLGEVLNTLPRADSPPNPKLEEWEIVTPERNSERLSMLVGTKTMSLWQGGSWIASCPDLKREDVASEISLRGYLVTQLHPPDLARLFSTKEEVTSAENGSALIPWNTQIQATTGLPSVLAFVILNYLGYEARATYKSL